MTYVLRGTSRAPLPRHDVIGQSLKMDLFKAETGSDSEAGLGGADVSAHSCPIDEQPATWKVAGCCAVTVVTRQ